MINALFALGMDDGVDATLSDDWNSCASDFALNLGHNTSPCDSHRTKECGCVSRFSGAIRKPPQSGGCTSGVSDNTLATNQPDSHQSLI